MNNRHWIFQLITLMIFSSCFGQQALSCSLPLPATPREIFDRSVAVFKGVPISVELANPGSIGAYDYTPVVKVRWRVEEVYKGQDLEDGSATTQYICGGVFVLVGQPYVFALGPVEGDEFKSGDLKGIIGYLDDQGTKGEWKDADEFKLLLAEFRKLRDGE